MMEMSLRQSLSMSSGSYGIFINRPIAAVMLTVGLVLLLLSVAPWLMKTLDWRQRFGLASDQEKEGM
jgi:putative tricarboxylic transport membrane protein